MSLVALISAKGSPGVTTAAVALAAGWPVARSAVVVETDLAGGDIAAACGLALEPGLGSLASAGRHGFDAAALLSHAQRLPCGAQAVVGPLSDDEAGAALDTLTPNLKDAMASAAIDVLADCGRFAYDELLESVLRCSDLALVVSRPTLGALEHVRSRLERLRRLAPQVALLLVGERPYPAAEVAEALACEVLGPLADDPRGTQGLLSARGGVNAWWLARSPLVRSARGVAEELVARLGPDQPHLQPQPFSLAERFSVAGGAPASGLNGKLRS